MFSKDTHQPRSRRGIALIVTLVLLSLLIIVILSLVGLTRVENRSAENTKDAALARANALTSLNIAIGQLQKHAGPDQRATARADLTAGVANPYYTGVWDTTVAGATATNPQVWLVSGNEAAPVSNTPATDISGDANSVLLVDDAVNNAANLQVRVLKQPFTSNQVPGFSGAPTIGHYAYWIGDEGVKARADIVSPWPVETTPGAQRDFETGYNFAMAQRIGVEQMAREVTPPVAAGTAIGTAAYVPNGPALNAVLTKGQLPLSIPSTVSPAERSAVSDAYRHRFHDLTAHSLSVLADQRAGGLKKDLSRWLEAGGASYTGAPADTDYIFGASAGSDYYLDPPTWGVLRSFANTTSNGTAINSRLPDATTQGISPVLLWMELGFSVGLNPGQTNLRMHYFPRVLLWNPYNVPINMTGDLEVAWLGEDALTMTITARGAGTGSAYYNMSRNAFDAATGSGGFTNFVRFRIQGGTIPAGVTALYTLQASGVYNTTGDNVLELADNPANSVYIEDSTIPFTVDPDPLVTEKITATYPAGGGEMAAYLREWVSGQPAITAPSPNTFQFISRVGAEQTPAVGSIDTTFPDTLTPWFRAAAYARLAAANDALPMRWIANGNIRAPYSSRSAISADNSAYHPLYNGRVTTGATPAVDSTTVVNRNYFNGGTVPDALVLFQVPRADTALFSVADLRHAHLAPLSTGPSYPVATSLQDFRIARVDAEDTTSAAYPLYDYAYQINQALWDRYHFSTVPTGLPVGYDTDPNYASLPNGRLLYYLRNGVYPVNTELLDPDKAAANLVLNGGFNVNSTSVQAWRAQLAALNAVTFDPVNGTYSATMLNRAFSRFLRPPANSANAWRGFRELTDDQLNGLAEAIVAEIRARGPFLSLSEFVNRDLVNTDDGLKGPLQEAIDNVDLGGGVYRINDSVPLTQDLVGTPTTTAGYDLEAMRGLAAVATAPVSSRNAGVPGNLTQADILAALGATLTARSDTFLVRAYGDVVNPATGATSPVARAWCEAVVQRMPDYINSSDGAEVFPPTNGDNQAFGRRFEVVSFRWLTPDDI